MTQSTLLTSYHAGKLTYSHFCLRCSVEHHPVFHHSADYTFISFGITGPIVVLIVLGLTTHQP